MSNRWYFMSVIEKIMSDCHVTSDSLIKFRHAHYVGSWKPIKHKFFIVALCMLTVRLLNISNIIENLINYNTCAMIGFLHIKILSVGENSSLIIIIMKNIFMMKIWWMTIQCGNDVESCLMAIQTTWQRFVTYKH